MFKVIDMPRTSTPQPIPMATLEKAADVLRMLCHPHRLKIVELLLRDRLTVGELADRLELAPNAVSQHLTHMKAHGLLTANRDGREVYYQVSSPQPAMILDCIRKNTDSLR